MSIGFLILETGEVYQGRWEGGQSRAGEVVFNTSHSGYEEVATDPSYMNQIVLMTAPMQGNYGIDQKVWESRKIWIEGFISLQIRDQKDGWKGRLQQFDIPCLSEVDTRKITLRLREGGTPWGALVKADSADQAKSLAKTLIENKKHGEKDWVYQASVKKIETREGLKPKGPKIAVLDFGSKENILRELSLRASSVTVFPSRTPVAEILSTKPDGVMLTNGPGDPSDVQVAVATVQSLLGKVPVFGICMGHQILGLALGAKTYKMKFGHRGANHPIQDAILKKVYMTSQNHGYAVEDKSLPKDIQVTHRNLNDKTVAGFYSEQRNCLGIQYHPESHPGPHDAVGLFDFFVDKMIQKGRHV